MTLSESEIQMLIQIASKTIIQEPLLLYFWYENITYLFLYHSGTISSYLYSIVGILEPFPAQIWHHKHYADLFSYLPATRDFMFFAEQCEFIH